MTFRPLLPALVLLLCQCATPPKAPIQTIEDDDRRLVTRADFAQSHWTAVPGAAKWSALPSGVTLTLADGRLASLTFPAPSVVRWWVAAGAGEAPLSPGAQYPETGVPVKVTEVGGVLSLDTPALAVRLKLADLSWTLVRGDTAVLHTAGGPRTAGRRLMQAFAGADATWYGPGLETERSAKFWISNADPESSGHWAVPFLYGAGGAIPFAIALDTSYQSYTKVAAEASLGTLNGGLDLLVAASPEPEGVIEALTSLTGRPASLPAWAPATALVAGTPPDFVRRAKLSIGTLRGNLSAPGFATVADGPPQAPLPDLSNETERRSWSAWARLGAAVSAFGGSQNWSTRWVDGGRNSSWARMNNLVPTWEALAVHETQNTGQNLLLTASAGPGTVRWAVPELEVTPRVSLPTALDLGLAGLGALAVRLDLSSLASPETREAGFRSLLAWMMAPVLTLDWGPDPAALWSSLSDVDKKRLKGILDLRSGFQPLFAQVARHTASTGAPAWRPVWFAAPRDPAALVSDEFLIGDLLVAPLPAGATTRKVYLPGPGVWFDFWTGEEFGGGRTYDVGFSAETPPLFAKGGAFVPVRDPESYDGRTSYNPLTMHVFPGGRGEGTYYYGESDGKPGDHVETRLVFDYAQREMTIEHQAVTTAPLRVDPYMLYRLHNVYKPRQVAIDGRAVPLFGPSWGVTDSDRSAAWYEDDRSLLIKTFRPERNQTITMLF